MPDYGERPAEQNERRLETASYRDPPSNNYGIRMLERTLPSQQQQQQSGGRRVTGGIMRLANYRGWTVNIRAPKWKDNQFWISCEDLEAAQYIADAAYYFTGRLPFHFPDANFNYLPLLLSTGERLTTREKCSTHLAKIAKDPALSERRKDFRDQAQKLILEMVKTPDVVQFLNSRRASPAQAWQPRPEANPEDTDSPFPEGENGTAMEIDTPSEETIQASASTVLVNPSQYGNLVPGAEETGSFIADDDGEQYGWPMEVDSLSEEVIQAVAPTVTVDPTAVLHFDSTWTNIDMDVDLWTSFIPSFEMDPFENYLTSAGQSLGIWHPRFGEKEKEKEDLVPDNCKELLAFLDREEEETWKSTECLERELWPESSPTIWPTFAASGYSSSRIRIRAEPRHDLRCGCQQSFATPCEAHFASDQMEGLRHSEDGLMPCERMTIP